MKTPCEHSTGPTGKYCEHCGARVARRGLGRLEVVFCEFEYDGNLFTLTTSDMVVA